MATVAELEVCTTCRQKLSGMLNTNYVLQDRDLKLINLYEPKPLAMACSRCGLELHQAAIKRLKEERKELSGRIEKGLRAIPVISLQTPLGWDYSVIGMVTAQTVTGTGLFSDVTTLFTDTFGLQSGAYNKKLRAGEDACCMSLRAETFALGGNAVIAADIDYAEVGTRAMLMVCMTGTAIKLRNPEILANDQREMLADLRADVDRNALLAKYGDYP